MNAHDRITWANLAKKYSADDELVDRFFDELVKEYSRSSRHYHSWKHIQNLLRLFEQHADKLQEKDIIHFSIYYHDFVYNVLRKNNEKRSGVAAAKRLRMLKVPEPTILHIVLFIEATQTHQIPQEYMLANDLAWFLDFDMAILGAGWENYKTYMDEVRSEYSIYAGPMYKAGRKKFLQSCLDSEYIFHTHSFRNDVEPSARQNIVRELELYQ